MKKDIWLILGFVVLFAFFLWYGTVHQTQITYKICGSNDCYVAHNYTIQSSCALGDVTGDSSSITGAQFIACNDYSIKVN